ncbi:hypothetical protein GOBAR_AA13588 [Gossypium barbadense]|uniref:Uncharacterized protein n=1 Tax=Gossypium barbadense TaxID=3634 RepID=A0A2P5XUP5_GOSBA|nr:hypothetical protein GOBAR_AA13588 [Gossypium barbadense]
MHTQPQPRNDDEIGFLNTAYSPMAHSPPKPDSHNLLLCRYLQIAEGVKPIDPPPEAQIVHLELPCRPSPNLAPYRRKHAHQRLLGINGDKSSRKPKPMALQKNLAQQSQALPQVRTANISLPLVARHKPFAGPQRFSAR